MKHLDQKLRRPIMLLLGALLLGAGIFHLSLNTRLAAEARLIKEKALAEQAACGAREAPARLIQDQAETQLHNRIRNSGLLGPEDRVSWITALAQTQAKLRIGSLSWHMTPQTASPLAPNLNVSNLEFTASPLDADKLAALIGLLRATAPGRFTIERCALTLEPNGVDGQAICRLNWWTMARHED